MISCKNIDKDLLFITAPPLTEVIPSVTPNTQNISVYFLRTLDESSAQLIFQHVSDCSMLCVQRQTLEASQHRNSKTRPACVSKYVRKTGGVLSSIACVGTRQR
jgi:hypothetical protein